MEAPVIYLTDEEKAMCDEYAEKFHAEIKEKGIPDAHDGEPDLNDERFGHRSEYALSKYLGVPWTAKITRDKLSPDVGTRTQVRSSYRFDYHRLIIRPKDMRKYGEDQLYVLVLHSEDGGHILAGWCHASERNVLGKFGNMGVVNRRTGKPRPPCWFIERDNLHPITEIKNP